MLFKKLLFAFAILLPVYTLMATNVKDYGAKGDGIYDDTRAICDAIAACDDGQIVFPAGRYRLTRSVAIDLTKSRGPMSITGTGGTATVIMEAAGPAFSVSGSHKGSALPASVSSEVWLRERMFVFEDIEIVGKHPLADGIALRLLIQPVVRGCLIRDVKHGIRLAERNRNIVIEGSHVYNCSGVGVYLDSVNIHQMIISHSHISYCAEAGIKVRSGEIRNFQITGNDIEYNCSPEKENSADICFDLSGGGSVREGTISGNTIQAVPSKGGANIRFTGHPEQAHKVGLWSITGNHISNQEAGIYLKNTQGISITGNTFIRAYDRHLRIENSSNITFTGNVIDHNTDYFTAGVAAPGGVRIMASEHILLHDNVLDGISRPKPEEGAALEIIGSTDVSVKSNMLLKVRNSPVEITDSPCTVLEGNTISMFDKSRGKVSIRGRSEGSIVTGNRIPGLKIENSARRVTIRKNQSRER